MIIPLNTSMALGLGGSAYLVGGGLAANLLTGGTDLGDPGRKEVLTGGAGLLGGGLAGVTFGPKAGPPHPKHATVASPRGAAIGAVIGMAAVLGLPALAEALLTE